MTDFSIKRIALHPQKGTCEVREADLVELESNIERYTQRVKLVEARLDLIQAHARGDMDDFIESATHTHDKPIENREDAFPKYIRRCRKNNGLTLRSASMNLETAFGSLARIERGEGKRPPNVALLQRMARFYNVDFNDLCSRASEFYREKQSETREDD